MKALAILILAGLLACNGFPKRKKDVPGVEKADGKEELIGGQKRDELKKPTVAEPQEPAKLTKPTVLPTDPESQDQPWTTDLPVIIVQLNEALSQNPDTYRDGQLQLLNQKRQEINLASISSEKIEEQFAAAVKVSQTQSETGLAAKPKLRLEVRDENGEDLDVAPFGMPEEADWVLEPLRRDPSLLRSSLGGSLQQLVGQYTPRFHYVSVFVADPDSNEPEYLGVYTFSEKIKRDKNRINIEKLKAKHLDPDEITGGYLLEFDTFDDNDNLVVVSDNVGVVVEYPKNPTPVQLDWLQEHLKTVEAGINAANDLSALSKLIDVDSFVDLFLVTEISKKAGGYRLDTYLTKDRGKRLSAGPVSDFELGFGADEALTADWIATEDDVPAFFTSLFKNQAFQAALVERYLEHRQTIWSDEGVDRVIGENLTEVGKGGVNNLRLWEAEVTADDAKTQYQESVNQLKSWTLERLKWLDANLKK